MCGLLCCVPASAWAADRNGSCGASETEAMMLTARHVRPGHEETRLAGLLANGIARSSTFRGVIGRLEASDVIVYVSFATSSKLRSYLPHQLTATADYRYLRIVVAITLSDREAIPVLGHELQHVLEVAASRDVRDAAGMTALFNRIGYPVLKGSHVRETDAALRVQQEVKLELASSGECRE